jgi:hypothetical protein
MLIRWKPDGTHHAGISCRVAATMLLSRRTMRSVGRLVAVINPTFLARRCLLIEDAAPKFRNI